jgi:hypothetical protein
MSHGDDEAQLERFKQAAREAGCDEDERGFERALRRIAKAAPQAEEKPKKKKGGKRK